MLDIRATKDTLKNDKKLRHGKIHWRKGIITGTMLAGESVVKRAQNLLNTGVRTGRKYRQLPNRSSAPGEMPRTQSGRLASLMKSRTGSPNTFSVLNTAPYAKVLATGDFERNLKPRKSRENPWLKFVIDQGERNTDNYLRQGVLKEIV